MKRSAFWLLAALVAFGCTPGNAVEGATHMEWVLNGPALTTLTTDRDAVRYFSGKTVFFVRRNGDDLAIPAGWDAKETRIFTSYRSIENALQSGRIGPDVKAVIYDNERWKFTPEEEQRHFADYSARVAQLLHGHGILLVNAPATTLARVLDPGNDKPYDGYIHANIAADAARHADVFVIQAQGSVMSTSRYRDFVRDAAAQARKANPSVKVLAGISTSPNGQAVSDEQLYASVEATRSMVDGYWLNVPAQSPYCPNCVFAPEKALELLRRLGS